MYKHLPDFIIHIHKDYVQRHIFLPYSHKLRWLPGYSPNIGVLKTSHINSELIFEVKKLDTITDF